MKQDIIITGASSAFSALAVRALAGRPSREINVH